MSKIKSEEIELPERKKQGFTVDEAIEICGFGKFQILLSLLAGLSWVN